MKLLYSTDSMPVSSAERSRQWRELKKSTDPQFILRERTRVKVHINIIRWYTEKTVETFLDIYWTQGATFFGEVTW